jgi:hypothetical protein
MKASGLGTAPRKLLEEMKEIKSLDVILPTREKKIRLRVLATAPKELKILLQSTSGRILNPRKPDAPHEVMFHTVFNPRREWRNQTVIAVIGTMRIYEMENLCGCLWFHVFPGYCQVVPVDDLIIVLVSQYLFNSGRLYPHDFANFRRTVISQPFGYGDSFHIYACNGISNCEIPLDPDNPRWQKAFSFLKESFLCAFIDD